LPERLEDAAQKVASKERKRDTSLNIKKEELEKKSSARLPGEIEGGGTEQSGGRGTRGRRGVRIYKKPLGHEAERRRNKKKKSLIRERRVEGPKTKVRHVQEKPYSYGKSQKKR